jgi:hypothetical protein
MLSPLNKFKDSRSEKSLKKIQYFVHIAEKCFKIHKECIDILFFPNKITNDLGIDMYKKLKICDKI